MPESVSFEINVMNQSKTFLKPDVQENGKLHLFTFPSNEKVVDFLQLRFA